MRKKKKFLTALSIAGLLVTAVMLFNIQISTAERRWDERLGLKESEIASRLRNTEESAHNANDSYDEVYISKAKTAAYMAQNLSGFGFDEAYLTNIRERLNVTNVIIADRDGNILAEASKPLADSFSVSRFNMLRTVFDTDEDMSVSVPFTVDYVGTKRRYYASNINDYAEIIIEQNPAELEQILDSVDSYEKKLKEVNVGVNGFVFSVSSKDYTFKSFPDNSVLVGNDALEAGINAESLQNGKTDWMRIGDKFYYCGTYFYEKNSDYIIAAVPAGEILRSAFYSGMLMLIIMAAALAAVAIYAYCVTENTAEILIRDACSENRETAASKDKIRAESFRKVCVVGIIALLVMAASCIYIQALYTVSNDSISNLNTIDEIRTVVYDGEITQSSVEKSYDKMYLNKCQTASYILSSEPELKNKASLYKLAGVLDAAAVYTFNSDGKMTASSTSDNVETDGYTDETAIESKKMLNGGDYLITKPSEAGNDTADGYEYITVPLTDIGGMPEGFVQVALSQDMLSNALKPSSVSSILKEAEKGINGLLIAADAENGSIVYYPDSYYIGMNVSSLGLTDEQLSDEYSGYFGILGEDYFGKCIKTEKYYILTALKSSSDLSGGFDLCAAYMLIMGLILNSTVILSVYNEKFDFIDYIPAHDEKTCIKADTDSCEENESGAGIIYIMLKKLKAMTPEEKLSVFLQAIFFVFAAAVFVTVIYGKKFLKNDSVLAYILNRRWERDLNIFSVTAAIMTVSVINVCLITVRHLLKQLSMSLGARGATICQLMRSFIKYLTWVCTAYYCMLLFGVNAKALLASAGVFSIIIGLGAQSLVSDILAGLFIIFEGDFRVGDIVTIGEWTGTVREIGVRTTKIESFGNDIKIFANSAVTGVINMTNQSSIAVMDVTVSNDESIEHVESVLSSELPKVKELIPEIIEGPYYVGIKEFTPQGSLLTMYAKCDEKTKLTVQYKLNRAIKLIFDKNGIAVPSNYIEKKIPVNSNENEAWIDVYRSEQFVIDQNKHTGGIYGSGTKR